MGYAKEIFCCAILLTSLSGFALTETVNGITWTYTVVNGEARLGNDSSSIAVPTSTSGAIVVPSTLGGYSVKAIGAYAFRGCSRLTNVTVPSSVTSIADSAFNGCSGLTEITVPFVGLQRGNRRKREALFGYIFGKSSYSGGIKMTQFCTETSSGSSFYIPSSLRHVVVTDETLLGFGAFSGLSGLTSITIGDSVTSIESLVFSGCSGLRNVAVPQCVCSSSLSFVFPSAYQSITNVVILAGVTSIGSSAFSDCRGLTNMTIPDSVTSIGYSAFSGCSGLSAFEVGSGNANYSSANGLLLSKDGKSLMQGVNGDVMIPNGVTSIGYSAFSGRSGLTSVTIPSSVTSIGSLAFEGCSGLTNVTIPYGVTSIGSSAFSGCSGLTHVTIPDSVTGIWGYAFYRCSGLTSVTIPNRVTSIGDSAFYGCSGLTSMVIPNSVTSIGASAFSDCSGLTSMTIPDSVTSIGSSAFSGCSGLASVTIPTSVTSIGSSAFSDCSGLASVTIPTSVTSIGSSAFSGCSGLRDVTVPQCVCSSSLSSVFPSTYQSITNVVILSGVTSIGSSAFSDCSGLASVTIPDSVTSIGDLGFYNCTNLLDIAVSEYVTNIGYRAFYNTPFYANQPVGLIILGTVAYEMKGACPIEVTIPEGVTSIGDYVFDGCSGLKSVIIPDSVTSMGNWAFNGCSGLTSVAIPNSVTSIGSSAFSGCSGLTSVHIDDLAAWCNVSFADSFANPLRYAGNLYVNEELVNDLAITDGVKDVAPFAFYGCCGITSLTIPDSVTRIGTNAFYGCTGLTSVTFGNGVTNVGRVAFGACSNLACVTVGRYFCEKSTFSLRLGAFPLYTSITNVVILDGVTNIGVSAFSGLRGLRDVTIPDSVTGIGTSAFYNCTNLTSIAIPGNVTSIGNQAFYGCSGLASMTIPDGVTSIGDYAFYKCTGLTEIILPNSVTNIGSYAFIDCTGLTCVAIPTNLTRMGACAFYTCTNLTSVTIPASVTSIGESAFGVCSSLSIVVFDGNAPTVGRSVFDKVASGCQAYVHRASTGWNVTIPGTWNGLAIDYMRHDVMFDTCGGEYELTVTNVVDGATVGEFPWPTRSNAAFLGWFTAAEGGYRVDETTAITGSVTLYAHWLLAVDAPVVEANAGNPFRTDTCEVWIACATDGATIYYADDGTTPKIREEYLYTGPFTITDTTTIKAVAVYGGLKSKYTTLTIEKKPLTLEEALGGGDGVTVETSESVPWMPVVLNGQDARSPSDVFVARSGAIGDRTNTWLTATVEGAGTMSFWCKTFCEHDEEDTFSWDRLMVYTNGVEIVGWRMDGETDWTERTLSFDGGTNTVKWVYLKDRTGKDGEDCAWVDGITWVPAGGMTDTVVDMGGGKTVTVPGDWLANIAERIESAGGDVAAALQSTAANGRLSVAECYVLGVDPEVAEEDFKITSITIGADGKPVVEFEPPQAEWNVPGARAVLKGAERLEGPWGEVGSAGGESAYRFFKVEVVLP